MSFLELCVRIWDLCSILRVVCSIIGVVCSILDAMCSIVGVVFSILVELFFQFFGVKKKKKKILTSRFSVRHLLWLLSRGLN